MGFTNKKNKVFPNRFKHNFIFCIFGSEKQKSKTNYKLKNTNKMLNTEHHLLYQI